jgi:hypothetical protein
MAAPQCDLTQPSPIPDPQSPQGFQLIPTGATLPQAVRIINNNFLRLAPINTFNNNSQRGAPGSPGRAGKNATEGNWTQKNIVTQRVRVYHIDPDGTVDKTQFIDFVRVNRLTMSDQKTGATWVYNRKGVDGPNVEILQSSNG